MVDHINDFVEYSIGTPLEGVEMKIVDESGDTLPVNEKAEIYIKNEAMFKEYCNDKALTRQRITDDGWYKTDDVGYMTENGVFFCTGRKSEIILCGGLCVTPSIFEAILASCPGVARVACVPVLHEVMFQVVCACVVRKNRSNLTEEDLRKFCEGMFTDKPRLFTVVPSYYMFFDTLPQTYTGKIDKTALKKRAEETFGAK